MTAVQYVLASVAQSTLDDWRRVLGDLPGLDFRLGAGSAVSHDCDAQIVTFYLAHDRYGGTPEIGRSQILTNTRGDGSPAIIVATPPFASGPEISDPPELAERMHVTFSSCFNEIARLNTTNPDTATRALIHIEGLDLEDISREPSITALRQALARQNKQDA
ncbi:hypothetical protein [Kutzneria sp. NPDC052558]|uniref:hypothetical protein n=1 Tax=Kutzneria sp. NPDC052558 TaxID=3364121 RepID=UPI0037CBBADC